jgi:hypothetical protein
MVKKSVTIDDLAVMVQKGFADTATKHRKRIEKIEAEIKELRELLAM